MKNWKKLAIVTSLSLALGFVGGHITYPKLQPKIKKVAVQRNIADRIEKYKGLDPEGLTRKDFIHGSLVVVDDVKKVINSFTADEDGLWVKYETNDVIYDNKRIDYRSSRTLSISNRKNIRFDAVYDSEGKPKEITVRTYNPEYKEGESFLKSEINIKKDNFGDFYINQLRFPNEDLVKVEDEKSVGKVKEFFSLASKKYVAVGGLLEKQ